VTNAQTIKKRLSPPSQITVSTGRFRAAALGRRRREERQGPPAAAAAEGGMPFPTLQLMVRDPADYTDREVKTRMLSDAAGVFVGPLDDPTAAATSAFGEPTFCTGPITQLSSSSLRRPATSP
jgi:hypothetical protein